MQRLKDKVTIITGATSGMGLESAKVFAQEGAKVIITGRRQSRIDELVQWAKDNGLEMDGIALDITAPESVKKLVDFTIEKHGRIDVLFNNHGMVDQGYTVPNVPDDVMDEVINCNLTSCARLCGKVLPYMLEQKSGSIIITSSVCGIHGYIGSPIYTASKHGVVGLTKNMAYQYANTGVRINSIAPGHFVTEVLDRWGEEGFGADKTFTDKMGPVTMAAMTGSGELKDIAYLAVYLASDESKFVNGTIIPCDGGWSAY